MAQLTSEQSNTNPNFFKYGLILAIISTLLSHLFLFGFLYFGYTAWFLTEFLFSAGSYIAAIVFTWRSDKPKRIKLFITFLPFIVWLFTGIVLLLKLVFTPGFGLEH